MAGAKPPKTSCLVPVSTLSVDSKIMDLKYESCISITGKQCSRESKPFITLHYNHRVSSITIYLISNDVTFVQLKKLVVAEQQTDITTYKVEIIAKLL